MISWGAIIPYLDKRIKSDLPQAVSVPFIPGEVGESVRLLCRSPESGKINVQYQQDTRKQRVCTRKQISNIVEGQTETLKK